MFQKFFRFLGSIRLAIPLLSLIIIILIGATFYESKIGTSTVQDMVYKSPWFGGLMFLLAINLAASALSRYPWQGARKIGFAITHFGLIVIIAGSAAVIHLGTEGMLLVRTDRAPNDQMRIDGDIVEVLTPDQQLTQKEIAIRPDSSIHPQTVGDLKLLNYAENTMKTVRFESGKPSIDNLAIRLQLSSDRMGQQLTRWLALNPFSYQTIDLGMANLELIPVETKEALETYLSSPIEQDSPSFRVLVSPQENLYYTANSSQGFQAGELQLNQPVKPGWADFEIKLADVITHAQIQREVIPIAKGNTNNQSPGLLVETKTGERQWLQWGEPTSINTADGKFYVAFSPNLKELPFAIQLDDFIVERNEGSQSVAMWTSQITIKNPDTGEELQREVWMNHPTWYQGWKIAQASWNPGDLEQSTLQIKREPMWVTALTFGGSGLVVFGIGIMFYGRAIAKKVSSIFPRDSASEKTRETAVSLN